MLSGQGSIARPLPISPNPNAGNGIGCRVGADLGSASQSEPHFGFANSSLNDCERNVLRYNRETSSLGTSSGRDGESRRLSHEVPTTALNPNRALEGTPNYAPLAEENDHAQWGVKLLPKRRKNSRPKVIFHVNGNRFPKTARRYGSVLNKRQHA